MLFRIVYFLSGVSLAFSFINSVRPFLPVRPSLERYCESADFDDCPSDSACDYAEGAEGDVQALENMKMDLLDAIKLKQQMNVLAHKISLLEAMNPNPEPSSSNLLQGSWLLEYTDDDPTRSSPFFWGFKKATEGLSISPLGGSFAENIFAITDNIPIRRIGECKQTFDGAKLSSEVRVEVFPVGSSLMTTTSSWAWVPSEPQYLELTIEKTQVLDSTVMKMLPFSFDDENIAFPSGSALELAKPGSSSVFMKVIYLDENLRISRNEDDKVFVHSRI